MKSIVSFRLTGCLILLQLLITCSAKASGKPLVFVSILPQKYFVERIAGDKVDVRVLVGPGQSPATYEPRPRQMAELSKARALFRIGVPFEQSLMPKIQGSVKSLSIIDTRKGIKLRDMEEEEKHSENADHGHDKGENHEHEHGLDPHVWMDPLLVKIQAGTIAYSLSKLDPAGAKYYQSNLESFAADLDKLNAELAEALAPMKGMSIFVFHPAYGYFTDRYGLKQSAVETGGKRPSAKRLAALINQAKAAEVKVIFVQPQFDKQSAETVAKAINGVVIPLDPLARDYISNLRLIAHRIKKALSPGK